MNIAIIILSEQKGFLISLGKELRENHGKVITYVAADADVENLIRDLDQGEKDIFRLDQYSFIESGFIGEIAKEIEVEYDINFSEIMAADRGIGQGYLFNAQRAPKIKAAGYSYDNKLKLAVENFCAYRDFLVKAECIFKTWNDPVTSAIAKRKGIHTFCLGPVKYGDRWLWCTNQYITSDVFLNRIKNNLQTDHHHVYEGYLLKNEGSHVKNFKGYSLLSTLKRSLGIIINDCKKVVRRSRKLNGYYLFAWVPVQLNGFFNYRFVKSIANQVDDVRNRRVVYFPLQLEPEVSLHFFSPEMTNSLEVIAWLSKSLPANSVVVVKEQQLAFGVRARDFYKTLAKIGNVVFADPDSKSSEWISRAEIVATITGTVGTEAVHQLKPVISFGKHQAINLLPTVKYASNFCETRVAVRELLSDHLVKSDLEFARSAYYRAQSDSSVDLPGYANTYKASDLVPEIAKTAVNHLLLEYPNIRDK